MYFIFVYTYIYIYIYYKTPLTQAPAAEAASLRDDDVEPPEACDAEAPEAESSFVVSRQTRIEFWNCMFSRSNNVYVVDLIT